MLLISTALLLLHYVNFTPEKLSRAYAHVAEFSDRFCFVPLALFCTNGNAYWIRLVIWAQLEQKMLLCIQFMLVVVLIILPATRLYWIRTDALFILRRCAAFSSRRRFYHYATEVVLETMLQLNILKDYRQCCRQNSSSNFTGRYLRPNDSVPRPNNKTTQRSAQPLHN